MHLFTKTNKYANIFKYLILNLLNNSKNGYRNTPYLDKIAKKNIFVPNTEYSGKITL